MDATLHFLFSASLIYVVVGQHHPAYEKEPYHPQPIYQNTIVTPPTQILHHKQFQSHDGNFKYAFAAENGLAQGEVIAPDGSRNGAYTYVDPTGRKISVKYTAGKEGFKILEGDHIPRDPPRPAVVPQANYVQPSHYSQPSGSDYSEHYSQPAHQITQYSNQPKRYPVPTQYTEEDDKKGLIFHDEPGKAHSFGSGYAFEITG
ncbi:hypothetical protein FQA39_LY00836 [Lamprigera yunnana]|nr:hypothetical protein FQA39_LY00836 [Lamprigera yunnana]